MIYVRTGDCLFKSVHACNRGEILVLAGLRDTGSTELPSLCYQWAVAVEVGIQQAVVVYIADIETSYQDRSDLAVCQTQVIEGIAGSAVIVRQFTNSQGHVAGI